VLSDAVYTLTVDVTVTRFPAILDQMRSNDLLDYFRHERQTWHWSVVLHFTSVKWWLLQHRGVLMAVFWNADRQPSRRDLLTVKERSRTSADSYSRSVGKGSNVYDLVMTRRTSSSEQTGKSFSEEMTDWDVSGPAGSSVRARTLSTLLLKNMMKSSVVWLDTVVLSSRRNIFDNDSFDEQFFSSEIRFIQ